MGRSAPRYTARVKRYKVVIWNFANRGGGSAAMRMLVRCDLRHLAQQDTGGWVYDPGHEEGGWNSGGFGCVRLEEHDPRLPLLLAELRAAKVRPHVRQELSFSRKERDSAPWLTFTFSTSLVSASTDQVTWDMDNACPECGAGARIEGDLVLRAWEMPKTGLAVCGHLIASREVADAVHRAGLTGVRIGRVRRGKKAVLDPRLRWLNVLPVMPPWSPKTRTEREGRCPACDRVGHFHHDKHDGLWYRRFPAKMFDFNRTWEEQGGSHRFGGPCVGGEPRFVISQRARQVLLAAGVRLSLQPVRSHASTASR